LIVYYGTDYPDCVRIWIGQRYLTYRCFDFSPDFYREERWEVIVDEPIADGQVIDDEEALRAADEEVRRQADNEGAHRYRLGGP